MKKLKTTLANALARARTTAVHRSGCVSTVKIIGLAAFLTAALTPELAMAAPWDGVANQILAIFTGGLARTIAIIAVIACGIAGIAGKLSWDWAIKIIIGIVLMFGATAIVDYVIAAAA